MNLIIFLYENYFSRSKRHRTTIFKLIRLINNDNNNKINNILFYFYFFDKIIMILNKNQCKIIAKSTKRLLLLFKSLKKFKFFVIFIFFQKINKKMNNLK